MLKPPGPGPATAWLSLIMSFPSSCTPTTLKGNQEAWMSRHVCTATRARAFQRREPCSALTICRRRASLPPPAITTVPAVRRVASACRPKDDTTLPCCNGVLRCSSAQAMHGIGASHTSVMAASGGVAAAQLLASTPTTEFVVQAWNTRPGRADTRPRVANVIEARVPHVRRT